MKIKYFCLVLLAMCLICSSVYAIKPCNGLAGYLLGEKIEIEPNRFKFISNKEGMNIYETNFFTPFMDFNICRISLTQETGLVCMIYLHIKLDSRKSSKYFDDVAAVIESHYEINGEICNSGYGEKIKEFVFPEKRIMTLKKFYSGSIGLSLLDFNLISKAKEEEKQSIYKDIYRGGLQ